MCWTPEKKKYNYQHLSTVEEPKENSMREIQDHPGLEGEWKGCRRTCSQNGCYCLWLQCNGLKKHTHYEKLLGRPSENFLLYEWMWMIHPMIWVTRGLIRREVIREHSLPPPWSTPSTRHLFREHVWQLLLLHQAELCSAHEYRGLDFSTCLGLERSVQIPGYLKHYMLRHEFESNVNKGQWLLKQKVMW